MRHRLISSWVIEWPFCRQSTATSHSPFSYRCLEKEFNWIIADGSRICWRFSFRTSYIWPIWLKTIVQGKMIFTSIPRSKSTFVWASETSVTRIGRFTPKSLDSRDPSLAKSQPIEWETIDTFFDHRLIPIIQKQNHGYKYDCDLIQLFELQSLFFDYYLINIQFEDKGKSWMSVIQV